MTIHIAARQLIGLAILLVSLGNLQAQPTGEYARVRYTYNQWSGLGNRAQHSTEIPSDPAWASLDAGSSPEAAGLDSKSQGQSLVNGLVTDGKNNRAVPESSVPVRTPTRQATSSRAALQGAMSGSKRITGHAVLLDGGLGRSDTDRQNPFR